MDIVTKRDTPRFLWPEGIALAAYSVLVEILFFKHQPWMDEAQAWLIVRDNSLGEIFFKRLHYEGTPGLWHFLLWILNRAHVSYRGMHEVIALVGIATAWVILRWAPFPRALRLGLPFVFGFVYQTAIIPRSYSLIPILVFFLCILLTAHRERPVLFALIAGLLANCALASVFISIGFAALFFLRIHRDRRRVQSGGQNVPKRYAAAAGIVLVFWGAALFIATPAPDVTFGRGPQVAAPPVIGRVLTAITGIPRPSPTAPRLDVFANMPGSGEQKTEAHHGALSRAFLLMGRKIVAIGPVVSFCLSSSRAVALAFCVLLVLWLVRIRSLEAMLLFASSLVVPVGLGFSDHHASVVLTGLIATLWVACACSPEGTNAPWQSRLFTVAASVVLVEQICWTASAIYVGSHVPFDPSEAAVKFIRTSVGQKQIAGFRPNSIAVEPYFSRPIYFNSAVSYWPWQMHADPDDFFVQTVQRRPEFILVSASGNGTEFDINKIGPHPDETTPIHDAFIPGYLLRNGYREIENFCGVQPAHFGYTTKTCLNIYQSIP